MSIQTGGTGLAGLFRSWAKTSCRTAGVEAGRKSIRIARRDGRDEEGRWVLLDLDCSIEEFADSRRSVRACRDKVRRAGVPPGEVICAINSPEIDIVPLTLPGDGRSPLDELVIKHVRQHLNVTLEEAVIDYVVLPGQVRRPGEDTVAVLVYAAGRSAVDALVTGLEQVGLEIRRVITPACALASRVKPRRAGIRHLLVATGEEATSISVVEDGHVLFERMLHWGVPRLLGHLREELGLDESQGQKLLSIGGRHRPPTRTESQDALEAPRDEALQQVLEPEFRELIRELSGCLGYCDSFFRHAPVEATLLIGPLARSVALRAALEGGLGIPVRGPEGGFDLPGMEGSADPASFVTAASCALWSEDEAR